MARPAYGPLVVGGSLLGGLLVVPLAATGQTWELIPLAAIGGLTALFWRPIQVWAGRGDPPTPEPAGEVALARLEALEAELQEVIRRQRELQETLRWHERLLRRALEAPEEERIARREGADGAS